MPAVARAHAEIWAELESDGNLIGAHDLWIAAV
jgi:predicted nucleic acid-binding protein